MYLSSDRKRMSVIVRTPDGTIKLFCKGAVSFKWLYVCMSDRGTIHYLCSLCAWSHIFSIQDSVIYPRLRADDDLKVVTESHLNEFAKDGLRTLCVAQATIQKESYQVKCSHCSLQLSACVCVSETLSHTVWVVYVICTHLCISVCDWDICLVSGKTCFYMRRAIPSWI